jgi:hypothetical protein
MVHRSGEAEPAKKVRARTKERGRENSLPVRRPAYDLTDPLVCFLQWEFVLETTVPGA